MKNFTKRIYYFLVILSISTGVSLLSIFVLPYEIIKKAGNQLSRDGDFERLTFGLVQQLRGPALFLGIISLIFFISLLIWKKKSQEKIVKNINWLNTLAVTLIRDSRQLLSDWRASLPSSLDSTLLIAISLLAIGLRLIMINRPIEYDEAYTFTEFARHSFKAVLTDYHVPNNHIFHTILVRFSFLLFGNQVWEIRLPVLIASIFLIISMYFITRSYFDRVAGILAALLTATIPVLVLKSVSARGYIIVCLMMVIALILANYVHTNKNIAGWILFSLSCSVGFYTIPMMIYPAGFIFIWLASLSVSRQTQEVYSSSGKWLKYVFISGLLVILFSGLFYLPILLSGNVERIIYGNRVLHATPFQDFILTIPKLLQKIIIEWKSGLNPLLWWLLLIGFLLAFIPGRFTYKYNLSMPVVFIPYILSAVIIQRPFPIARIWIWILPLIIIWSISSLVNALKWVSHKLSSPKVFPFGISLLVIAFTINGIFSIQSAAQNNTYEEDPAVEHVMSFFNANINNNDLVIASDCSDARYWYYFATSNLSEQIIRNRKRPFSNLYVIVYTETSPYCGDQTLESVLEKDNPGSIFLNMDEVDLVYKYQYANVFKIGTYPDIIEQEYQSDN